MKRFPAIIVHFKHVDIVNLYTWISLFHLIQDCFLSFQHPWYHDQVFGKEQPNDLR